MTQPLDPSSMDDFLRDPQARQNAWRFVEGGPVSRAMDWLESILDRSDLRAAWQLTDPNFRLCLAQAWVWANRQHPEVAQHKRDELAAELAEEVPEHGLWGSFEKTTLAELHQNYEGFDLESWGAASNARPIHGEDYDLVLFLQSDASVSQATDDWPVMARAVLMHQVEDEWLVAALEEYPPTPGWPPTYPGPPDD